jgi:outer membrane cobalamin receptor
MSFKTQGFSRFNSQRTASTEKDGAESSQVFQASRHQWSQRFQTELYLQGSVSHVEQDGFDNSGNPIDTSFDESQNQNLQFIQTTTYQGELALSWLKTGINHIERDIKTFSQGKEFYRGDIRQVQLGQEVQTGSHTTIAGFNFDQENYQDKNLEARNDILSGFIQQKMILEDLSFFLGARGEAHQRYGEFFAYESAVSSAHRNFDLREIRSGLQGAKPLSALWPRLFWISGWKSKLGSRA